MVVKRNGADGGVGWPRTLSFVDGTGAADAWRLAAVGPVPQAAAPQGSNGTINATEDVLRVLTAADFGYSDSDGNPFAGVLITTVPAHGAIALNGSAVSAGTFVSAAQIAAGALAFEPAQNESGTSYASFTFQVRDSTGAQDASPNTIIVNVTPVNDAPVYTNLNSNSAGTFTEGQTDPIRLDAQGNGHVTDIDSADFDGGFLRVSITQNGVPAEDRLAIANGGAVEISGTDAGSTVSVNDVVIGTIAAGGTGIGEDLVVNFNAAATPARVELLVRALTYVDSNADAPSSATRTVAVTLGDGDGPQLGTTNLILGVMGTNDAPVLTMPTQSQIVYVPGNAPVALWAGVNVVDPDQQPNFQNGSFSMYAGGSGAKIELGGTRFTLQNAGGFFFIIDSTTGQQIGELSTSVGHAAVNNLTAAATPAVVNALIQSFLFSTEGANPAMGNFQSSLSFFDGGISGGFGSGMTSNLVSQTVTVGTPSPDPIVDLNGPGPGIDFQLFYTEGGTPVGLGTSIFVLDANGGNQIDKATIILSNATDDDVLSYGTLPAGVTATETLDNGQLVLTFTGGASPLAYSSLLTSVHYSTLSDSPPSQRSIAVTVTSDTTISAVAHASIFVQSVDDPGVANDDAFATTENGVVTGNVLADNGAGADTDPDSPPLVVAVNGVAADINHQIVLPSGALLTLFGGGGFTYDPHGAFDLTPAPDSGAANASPTDHFTYNLAGGGTGTVTIAIAGADGNDRLEGSVGSDSMNGGVGADTLIGGAGQDRLTGGAGADVFLFTSLSDSSTESYRSDGAKHLPDVIEDFTPGVDRIDLSQIDAIAGTPANDAFTFIGSAAFTHHAGELRCDIHDGVAQIYADVDGDGFADLQIAAFTPSLQGGDFIL